VGVCLFMNPRLVLVVVSLVLSLAIGLVVARSGGGVGEAKRARPLIGLSMDTLKEERWQVDRDLFLERAKALGVDVLVQSANSDDSVQLTQVQSLITQGVDALVIIPHNGEAMAKAVGLAHAAGVPVLSYDRLITGCDLDLYITFDNVKVGELQARFLADRVPEGGKMKVVRIYGSKTDNNAVLFKEGQDKVLKPLIEAGKVEVVFEDWAADWKPENAKKIMNAAITKNGPGIDAVLASNDGTAGGAVQALTEEGLAGKVLVTGQDGDLAACQRIVQGTQTMTVYKPIMVLASRAAEAAVRLAKGQSVIARSGIDNGKGEVPSLLLEIVAVTRENLRETIVADGFRAEVDVYAGMK
jgi:D-xylose transport system substrate-binding protein